MLIRDFIHLLKNSYPKHYNALWKENYKVLHEFTYDKKFGLADNQKHQLPYVLSIEDDSISIIYKNDKCQEVLVIDFEYYINQFAGLRAGQGKKSDYLILTTNQFIVNELTNSQEKYIDKTNGKRDLAKQQLKESIDKLTNVSDIKKFIDNINSKIALFAYRFTDKTDKPIIDRSRSMFMSTTKISSNIILQEDYLGFKFMQIIFKEEFDLV